MPTKKMLSRMYTTLIALCCTAAVAYAIHANGEAAKAGRALERAQKWERYARASQAHRKTTAKSLGRLIRQYNALARNATAEQRRLLVTLSQARRRAATAQPAATSTVTYETTQSAAVSQPAAVQPAPPAVIAAPAAPSEPTTKTS